MNKEKYLISKFCEFCKKYKIEAPLLKREDRLGSHYGACVSDTKRKIKKEKRWIVKYNMIVVKKLKNWEIIHLVLHELGHIKNRGRNEIESEYKAYKFTLKVLKKYHPQIYPKVLKYLIWYVGEDTDNHGKGFMLLVEEMLGL